jgi:hypothetical protein
MKEKESIFKEAITNQLENQLINLGYTKEEDWKGFLKYKCSNNYLKLVYEWNQSYNYSCKIGFNSNENHEFFLGELLLKVDKNIERGKLTFGDEKDFSDKINEWVNVLSNQIQKYQIQKITKDNPIIKELRNEHEERGKVYNTELQIRQTKREADEAWQLKDFKSFIQIMKNKTVELPSSYSKKLSIAEKKLKKENGA